MSNIDEVREILKQRLDVASAAAKNAGIAYSEAAKRRDAANNEHAKALRLLAEYNLQFPQTT